MYLTGQTHNVVTRPVMMASLCLRVVLFAVVAAVAVNADISVDCLKKSVKITWKIPPQLVPHAARLFLGNCMASHFYVLASGEGVATFDYNLNDCRFKRELKGKGLVYRNELTYRPHAKSKPADFTYPIECGYKRPDKWFPEFLTPGFGVVEGHGKLVFHMALLNEALSGMAKTNIIPLGSLIPIWAAVDQKSHQPLALFMEECVVATTPELYTDSPRETIITNKGCLEYGKTSNSRFVNRYHSSALILLLQSFRFGLGKEVYVHCKLSVWYPDALNENKKTCNYVKETGSWELLEDPLQSNLCTCCDSICKARPKRALESDSQGLVQNSVLGPLIIVDYSDTKTHNTTANSSTAVQEVLPQA
ncbi:zona pellucida glycoprotein 3f, tandem duplicate 2 [Lampris incognitus]|uniref:zona pellucida glycoprotein 3f, tandem duplicate 2 n=1 Tax=Lampris incognitus TaxID=2546036 RepID=UPI0024B4D478|nr:zona pellucida glycoprotein 3f, tandem duplicate 2 [Lampris incognitus]